MYIRVENQKLCGNIRAISSKSDVHRALLASALAKGETRVHFTTLSEDIKATVSVLLALGAAVEISGEDGAYTAAVRGIERVNENARLNASECGTTARLILPVAATLCDSFTLTGKNGLLKRPFSELCGCMGENGCICDSTLLPINAKGRLKSGIYKIRGDISSQYISGLLFALPLLEGDSEIRLTTPLVSEGYIEMTLETLSRFGIAVGKTNQGFKIKGSQRYLPVTDYTAEGDWSNACFWLAAGIFGDVTVRGLNTSSYQKDKDILKILTRAEADFRVFKNGDIRVTASPIKAVSFDGENMPDALPILATLLSLAKGESIISGGARLRIKESDRIATTAAMLKTLGATVTEKEDGFIINGVERLLGGEIDAANDHRIAMCAAVAATAASAPVIIRGAECVSKSYPTFFEDFERLGGKYSVING